MYDFQLIHNKILEDLSKVDKCSNFILTDEQFKNALDTNQHIIKPYVGFTNDKKEFIDIREHVIDKLRKYKVVGVKTDRYGEIKGDYRLPGGSGGSWTDNYYYIMYINIHGEVYGNIFEEKRNKEYYSSSKVWSGWQNSFISNDWYLELFIKPFAIQPEHCNTIAYKISNNINTISCIKNYISHFNDELYWSPYIDKNHYSCKSYCVDDKLIELYHDPKYKEYIESDKIIPKDIMDDILNDKIRLIENKTFKFSDFGKYKNCSSISGINCTGMNITKYCFDFNFDKIKIILNKLDNTTKLYKLYELKIQNYIMHKLKNSRGYETGDPTTLSDIRGKLTNLTTIQFYNNTLDIPNLNVLDICFLQSLNMNQYNINENNTGYHPGKFLNIYDTFYVPYLEMQNNKKEIRLLDDNIEKKILDNNKLIIKNYYKEDLDLSNYIPTKTKQILKNGELKNIRYTDIIELHIYDSNITNIFIDNSKKGYNNLKCIKLFNCNKFKQLSKNIENNILHLYIDNKEIEIIKEIVNKTNISKKI